MKSIKVKPGESFKLIITNDDGIEIAKQCYAFDPETVISMIRNDGVFVQMDLVPLPVMDKSKLYNIKGSL